MNEEKNGIFNEPSMKEREIRLPDIVDFVKGNFATIVACVLLGIASGITFCIYLPNKWQADITLQIGKIPIMQNFIYIDQPSDVVEKIKSPLFLSRMIFAMYGKNAGPNSPTSQLLYKDLSASVVKGGNLVKVNVFGFTADEAYRNAGILADSVIAEHQALAAPYLNGLRKKLADIIANIKQNNETLTRIQTIEQSAPSRNEANALLKLTLISAKMSELQKLNEERAKLEESLSTARLQPTTVVGRSLVPQAPSSPKRGLLIIIGAFFGLVLGVLLSFGMAIRR
jgi:hypothetical protein